MAKLYGKDDLRKLKESKPIPITAHTNEIVVPVVYAGMVDKYLKNKGITLPLTHAELREMKHEAQSLAKGGVVLGKKIKKIKKRRDTKGNRNQNQIASQKVVINLGEKNSGPNPPPTFPAQRPNYFAEIRPHSTAPMMLYPPDNKEKEKELQLRAEKETIDKYFSAIRRNPIADILQEQNRQGSNRLNPSDVLPIRGAYDFELDRYKGPQPGEANKDKDKDKDDIEEKERLDASVPAASAAPVEEEEDDVEDPLTEVRYNSLRDQLTSLKENWEENFAGNTGRKVARGRIRDQIRETIERMRHYSDKDFYKVKDVRGPKSFHIKAGAGKGGE